MASRAPLRSHPLARSKRAAQANAFLGKAWDKGWLPTPALDPAELWAIAAKPHGAKAEQAERGGRCDEDVADFRERLERLCKSINQEADLNPLGRAMAHGQVMRAIRNRLALGVLWHDEPGLLETRLAPPIIVIGHMRSGTTRIHKLLAADPAHSHTRYCDAFHPVPTRPSWRRVKGSLDLAMMRWFNPWLDAIHPMASGEVEEELGWLAAALNHAIYESQWRIPGFNAFSEARDAGPVYREFARILKTDAATRGCERQPRVLKVPQFSEDLACLLKQFPKARLVIARREYKEVHKSAVSLVANQMAIQSDSCDLNLIEAEWHRKLALREARMEAALADWSGPVARLEFTALNQDWQAAIGQCYQQLGLDLTDFALAAMRDMMAASENGHHHAHSAQLAHFAQTAAE
jgi:hypothetical protein